MYDVQAQHYSKQKSRPCPVLSRHVCQRSPASSMMQAFPLLLPPLIKSLHESVGLLADTWAKFVLAPPPQPQMTCPTRPVPAQISSPQVRTKLTQEPSNVRHTALIISPD